MTGPLSKTKFITVCFEYGDEFKKHNPFDIQSAFGTPITVAVGDVFAERDALEDEVAKLKRETAL